MSTSNIELGHMTAADVLLYVKAKYPRALQSPVALACHAATADELPLQEAIDHAERCLEARDGWDVETLGHNIESNFPEFEPEECDDIAAAVLRAQR